jgi:hypothetical protein
VTGMPADTAAAIEAIARAVQRLTPSWERPETFHEQKSEIVAALHALACSPLLTRRVVQFVAVPAASPELPADPVRVASRRGGAAPTRPRSRCRHRYPHPGRQPGQSVLGLESPR